MGKIEIAGREFTREDGNKGRTLMSQLLTDDKDVSPRIINDAMLNALRELVLTQTNFNLDSKTGLRIVPNSTNFFGGSVYSFDKTQEGFFLCTFRDTDKSGDGEPHPSDRIGGLLVMSLDGISPEGMRMLEEAGLLVDDNGEEIVVDAPTKVDDFKPEARTLDDGEVLGKINEIMANKMAGRDRKVSKPL